VRAGALPFQPGADPQPGEKLGRPEQEGLRQRFAGFTREAPQAGEGLKRAAVAICLTRENDFLLTRRAPELRAHAGQWALPGGRIDEGESAVDAALREMDEELGLRVAPDRVLGILDDYATRSGYLITPVAVWTDTLETLAINAGEVAALHRVPIELAAAPGAFDFVHIPESDRPVIRFHWQGHQIHAPTAAMLYQFIELLAGRVTRVAGFDQPVFAWR
jgi:8-oxo-dGTP pyrophosphatase MutT (NUDIX family)